MKHQQEITGQRLNNMKSGIKQSISYLDGINSMLSIDKPDIESIKEEMDELKDFLLWIQTQ